MEAQDANTDVRREGVSSVSSVSDSASRSVSVSGIASGSAVSVAPAQTGMASSSKTHIHMEISRFIFLSFRFDRFIR